MSLGRHHVEQVMGMAVSIDLVEQPPPGLLAEVLAWLHHVDAVFSPYIDDSIISKLGRDDLRASDFLGDDEIDDEVREVLLRCDDLRIETGGVFDPWKVPAPNGTMFDPSGFVKGWAVERAAEMFAARGVPNCCINAGGDIALRGQREPGAAWRVGIRHPDDPMSIALALELTGPIGIATSATYERGAHIVDPRTGQPATPVASATVVGRDLADADAYATTLFVMGVDGLNWLQDHTEYQGYVITHEGHTYFTPGFTPGVAPGVTPGFGETPPSSGGRTCRNIESSNRS